MADLERSPGRRPTRRQREERAYRLAVIGGVAGLVGVVGLALALITSFPPDIAVVAFIVALACWVMFRRAVSGR
jgi:hypothetical protein